ncbi:MAG: protein translocase subunit SecF [Anaerolineaceae bacterium]|nr:protein translocase subunit SecF [Anaerolineaceae bacterium]
MFNLVEKRRLFFLISAAVIVPGILIMIYSLVTTGALFRLSIDFVGGSIYELKFTEPGATETTIRDVFTNLGEDNVVIQQIGAPEDYRWSVRASFRESSDDVINALNTIAPLDRDSLRIEQVSATVGREVTQSAFLATMVAAVVVTGFIVIAFRQVPNAFRYGVCAVAAMFHDILVVSGIMSLAGLLLGWEVDALFLTAVLTVVGFSVQDTIVLFDRIRENIPKYLGEPYETIVNRSILETIHRSLATQLNAFFIMAAILLFGGDTIKQFIAILFVGLLTGTYSSIFTAVPLLVAWEKGEIPFINRGGLHAVSAEG